MKRRALLLLCLLSMPAGAHPLAPALLEITRTGTTDYAVLWRLSAVQPATTSPRPRFPDSCQSQGEPVLTMETGAAIASRWPLHCEEPLAGQAVAIEGLDATSINVIVRHIDLSGSSQQQLLDARRPSFIIPSSADGMPSVVWQRYLALGADHLWFGPDHLLFVLGLMLLVRRLRPLIWTLTAFTLGHSVTLSLAALEMLRVNPAVMEFGIALSIVVLARELLRKQKSLLGQHPGMMAFAFGLLHGLGFASALADIGLPQAAIVPALLAFNIGIELAQLAVVATVFALLFIWRGLPGTPAASLAGWRLAMPAYVMGGIAALWCLERLAPVLEYMSRG